MRLNQVSSRIINRLEFYAYKLKGKDNISLASLTPRKDMRELGTAYGGWMIPTSLLNVNSICYCVGCGEDISFDLALIKEFGCEIFAFDPTPRAIAHVAKAAEQNVKYHFFDVGLWDKEDVLKFYVPKDPSHVSHSLVNLQKTSDYIEVKVKRLSEIMREKKHSKVDLLKIDIEGAEYKVLDSILEDALDVKIICVEYDECFNPLDENYRQRIQSSVSKLIASGYALVCTQGNGNYTFVKN